MSNKMSARILDKDAIYDNMESKDIMQLHLDVSQHSIGYN